MANDCTNSLIVVGQEGDPADFAAALEQETYGGVAGRVDMEQGLLTRFYYRTDWRPNMDALFRLSGRYKGSFLLEYSCWESGFRGQAVIRNGEAIEHVHRLGYKCPGYLFADVTHPLVDLFGPYLQPTLAEQAAHRLQDAIDIVKELGEVLADRRFTESRYRAYGDDRQVITARARLKAMLADMVEQAAQIGFGGVLLEEIEWDWSRQKPASPVPVVRPRRKAKQKASRWPNVIEDRKNS